ncbi:roadblock/LC7 domain-containing protein [Spirillospora albida]|uniref:roadblock/LC7 domain-containing protein n=1 Tax=Spirillospora albida TaxID=58123 RepID=UPI0004BF93AF|nr:roadblock/LC7 domain-containing protein [Spirillospora albida]
MTIPTTSAALSSTALAGSGVASAPASASREGLGWLLEDFRAQVPGIKGAFLVPRDGLVLAAVGLTTDEADHAAAVAAALYSAGGAAGKITSPPVGEVQQIIVQHDAQYLILMNTPDQHPDAPAHATEAGTGRPAVVGCVLGVLAGPDAQTGLVADGMAMLIASVARHLVTATRTPRADTPAPQVPSTESEASAGLRDAGSNDEH